MAANKVFLLILCIIVNSNSLYIKSLNGKWLVRDESSVYNDVPATVPGGIYSDLMDNGIIGDIYYGYNDVNTNWVPRRNWTYYTNFSIAITDNILSNENVNLVFDGLDTFADIYVNDALVGSSRNMFVRYIFDVKNILKEGDNTIEVRFLSPIEVAASLAEEQAKQYVVPPTCPPDEYRGECNVNMIRKMQASYSWDWGPSFPSVGIWKDIYIEGYSESAIRYVAVDITRGDVNWYAHVDVYLANNARSSVTGQVKLQLQTVTEIIEQDLEIQLTPNEYGELVRKTILAVPTSDVLTWWPNGYGGQHMYNLAVTFLNADGIQEDIKVVRLGFRKIELKQDSLENGRTFYFEVNDKPIFMKGSNEIPLDILPERGQNKTLIDKMLDTVRLSHMNMLRVWGGGVYESDYFYDKADENGILIWQDFMFACAMYPTYDGYLENVIEEVRHQVNRLRTHPSVALFAGNNENEAALRQNWYGTGSDFELYYEDYVKLYITTIQTEVNRLTEERRIYLSSSPSNGVETISEGYVAQNPSDTAYGDVHYYNYVLNPWDSNIYPVSRFTSEYGYQALPSYKSMLKAAETEDDLNIDSTFMDHRQHHPDGNIQMKELIEFNLKLPDENHANYSKAFIYYLQIAQAVGIKVESEHYRRFRSYFDSQGYGGTMGALYWQLNDVWLAPTWSGIDFTGKWKMLHYFVTQFFAPMIITGHINNDRILQIYLVSDINAPLDGLTASIEVLNWNSLTPVYTEEVTLDVLDEAQSVLIKSIATDDYLTEQNCGDANTAKLNCFFSLKIKNQNGLMGPTNWVFPGTLKESNLQRPNVEIDSVTTLPNDESVYVITVTTDKVALFVWLDTDVRGRFSENGFVQVDSTKTIYFYSEETTTESNLLASLTITNLLDEQYF